MIVLDVNVLVAAFAGGHPHHEPAVAGMARALTSARLAIVPDVVWLGFARVTTTPGVLDPTPAWDAVAAFIEAVRSHPGCARSVRGLDADLSDYLDLCRRADARRNLLTDAYVAAVALANACPVMTFDRDFARFPGVQTVVPGT